MQLGYLGLGNMGGALARRLQLSHPLVVFDRDSAAVQRLVAAGASAAASPADLAARCDIVLLCLPTSAHVESALAGEEGLAAGLKPGTLVIDQTTGDPERTRAIASGLAERGVAMIDAPVSGGAQGAEAGTIAIMVGASQADFARARPVLEAISPNIHHVGEVGAGSVIKLVNNMMSATTRLITYEGVALAQKNGIDPEVACRVLLSGGARNSFLEKFMAPKVIKGDLFAGFTLGLMHKDLALACDLGKSSGVPLLAAALAREFYQMCINEHGYDAQVHTAALSVDRMSGTQVVPAAS